MWNYPFKRHFIANASSKEINGSEWTLYDVIIDESFVEKNVVLAKNIINEFPGKMSFFNTFF